MTVGVGTFVKSVVVVAKWQSTVGLIVTPLNQPQMKDYGTPLLQFVN